MKFLNILAVVYDRILGYMALIAAVLLTFTMLSVSTDVVMRYVFDRPMLWVVEITEYILLWIPFLGAAWLLKQDGHVKVDILLSRLNPRIQALLSTITAIIGLIICLVLVWYGVKVTWNYFIEGRYVYSPLSIPTAYVMGIVPLGCLMLIIQFVRRSYNLVKEAKGIHVKKDVEEKTIPLNIKV
jgi:TRAP-type C4-dicarboxylate transport system permease small subunit